MRKKMIWGFGALILIIGLVGVSAVLLMWNTDTEPPTVYRGDVEPSKEIMDSLRNQSLKNNPPPAEPGYKWVWHHNHWDKVPVPPTPAKVTPVIPKTTKVTKTTSDDKTFYTPYYMRIYKKYGVDPPPIGYTYRMLEPGILRLDENGNPILKKIGAPVVDIHKVPGFAPTYEQYIHYKELIRLRDHERRTGNDAAADQLNAEIRQLKDQAQGLIPIASSSRGRATEEEEDRLVSKVLRQAYIDMGLGYMIDY